ncbi:DUF5053 domain-containing protein [Dysgonomonas sp. 521]|uniref:DUF5053 domain-containing protein n=1 Tax=Dysgonomonas sp. 521 TaxID=2302932 RepID=UPI0013D3F643|nr:DUF5053 domain-containing protein [Dysgonomonas sp. 521]NDV97251.1 DUF5053 domain-containing protein [Dysgonomonas sp. 521]
MNENKDFLTMQVITYLGNKRTLLPHIETAVIEIKTKLQKNKLDCIDLFSGSGVVARMLKQHSNNLYVNDLELYSKIINECYLTNKSDFDTEKYKLHYNQIINRLSASIKEDGIIYSNYAPQDDSNIKKGERCFYTSLNAKIIDTIRDEINNIPIEYQRYFLAPLLYEASVHTNTSGVFKGFYTDNGIGKFGGKGENSLTRILGKIEVKKPIFSDFDCNVMIYMEDANLLVNALPLVDIAYIDCPYNQHSYSSNYHILNTICLNTLDENISKISGIPKNCNKSNYNYRNKIHKTFESLINQVKAEYLIISYSNEGFISSEEMINILSKHGKLKIKKIEYLAYRGSRNLQDRSKTVTEYLFILHKNDNLAELLTIKRKLAPILPYISLSTIAKIYFGKTHSWLYHKLNADVINGKQYQLNEKEIQILSDALDEIGEGLKSISKSLKE